MYLHATVSDRDSGSIFEEPFDGRSLSKLNLCEDGECLWLGLRREISPAPNTGSWHCPRVLVTPPTLTHTILHRLKCVLGRVFSVCFLIHASQHTRVTSKMRRILQRS